MVSERQGWYQFRCCTRLHGLLDRTNGKVSTQVSITDDTNSASTKYQYRGFTVHSDESEAKESEAAPDEYPDEYPPGLISCLTMTEYGRLIDPVIEH